MLNRTSATHFLVRAGLAVILVSLHSAACGSDAPTAANSGASTEQSSATAGSSSATTTKPAAAGGAGAAASTSKPAASSGNASGSTGTSATSAAPAAGSGGTTSASNPKGDVQTETAGSGAGGTQGSEAAAGAAGGTSAAAGSGGQEATTPAEPAEDYGQGDGSDVVTIGDSWMSIATNGGGIEGGLDRASTMYRHYAVAGTTLLNGGQIPGQYDQAKAINPNIKTIIMTGGGNDVMFSGGCNTKEACTAFSQKIADGLDELWMRAEKDGVTSVVYIQYSRHAGTAPEDTRPDMPAVPKICSNGKFRCVFIGTTDLIAASDTVDGIHPTLDGCDRIAKRTLEEMEKAGVRR